LKYFHPARLTNLFPNASREKQIFGGAYSSLTAANVSGAHGLFRHSHATAEMTRPANLLRKQEPT
jgi:hypothetical protein